MAFEYHYKRRVEFADTDLAGIVHFARYACFAEEAEHEFLRSLGLSVHTPAGDHSIGFPRLSSRIEFKEPMRFEDELDVHIWVGRKRLKSLTYQFKILREGRVAAFGEVGVVCCILRPGGHAEATPLPEAFDSALEEAPYPALEFWKERKE